MANKPIKSVNLLPGIFRTDKNDKFLSSTIDQLIQPPQLERLDGFIGSKFTPTYVSTSDIYISESLPLRQKYQLEPALIIKDSLSNIEQTKAIDDLANEINLEGGFNNNFDRLFRSEFYSLDPQIDYDKFVNYQKYYWLVTGPQTITITGKQLNSTSTYSVIDNEIKSAWVFSPDGLTEDPTLILYRNNTYKFSIDSSYKFYIKTAPTTGLDDVYNTNVTNNGADKGVVTLLIDENTPATLYYTSDEVNFVQGKIEIKSATEDAYIDVETEIIGKKDYVSGTGIKLSNGMKIKFGGEVFPETYKDKEYFVEGVGKSITLIDYTLLEVAEALSAQFDDDFDVTNFDQYPFDNFRKLPLVPEYLTINRASRDLNPWSRYNRWVHEDIIKISADYNGTQPIYPSDKRARRPIIEFNANLQLYNFGSVGIKNIDLIDNDTTDAFSTVEGSAGYYVDGVLLQQGHRVVFNADTDSLVRGKIYQVNYVNIANVPKLQLVPTEDHNPSLYNSLSVNFGNNFKDKTWWWNGDAWVLAQQHDKLNQAPLFDIFDKDGISYSSSDYKTNFSGCKIFSYEVGTGENDSILGFPLSYQNTVNIGSFKFTNHFTSDTFSLFQNNNTVETVSTALGYLRYNDQEGERYTNVWSLTEPYQIPIIQTIITDQTTSTVFVTAVENPINTDLNITAFVNGVKIPTSQYGYGVQGNKVILGFDFAIQPNTNIFVKILTNSSVNNESDGQYEPPLGLTNNPLNGGITSLTLTEISDHYKTMVERSPEFVGAVFGTNNSRDLYNISKYGTRLISNANPLVFSNIFLGIKEHDVIKSIQQAADQYNQFKYNLIKKITELGNINNPILALDNILTNINSDKDLNSPWYYSEMLAYGNDKTTRTWTVTDIRNTVYPITEDFDSSKLSFRSVLVYLNSVQLILDKDYRFLANDSSVEILTAIKVGDRLTVEDYFSTEGSYVPATPTKLGLYPKFEPIKYQDNTYVTPTNVIQGHDGSLMVAFNDFRDDIILEYEKRIFNNIKVSYRNDLIDFNSIVPGAFRQGQYSLEEVNKILLRDFVRYTSLYNIDYITNSTFDLAETLTWNYAGGKTISNDIPVSGYWRNIFKYLYDTDRPNTHPWEMLGFSQQPDWWEDEYGPAPYTSGNTILWHDIELGRIKYGPREGIDSLYVRSGLSNLLPVDEFGNLTDPTSLITNTTPFNIRQSWVFGDQGPAETSWRRSSYYPFAIQRLLALTKSSYYSAWMFDVSRMNKNIAGQWTYGDAKEFIKPKNLSLYSLNNQLAAGYSVYVIEAGKQRNSGYLTTLQNNLNYLDFNLLYKVGGFVSKNKLQILIDAIDPSSISSGALLPQESYNLILNTSNPVTSASMSGVIIQKFNGKFVIKGYDQFNPYFTVFTPRRNTNTPNITVGGVSEPFVVWTASQDNGDNGLGAGDTTSAISAATGNFYKQGQVVFYNQRYYRTKVSHKSSNVFNTANFEPLPFLPTIGGVSVQQANGWFKDPVIVPYGSEFTTVQEVYDVLVGYGKWLEDKGFVFNEYNTEINEILNWNLSAKEFMYWTTQNWAENSIITLSPFASKIQYSFPDTIVDNIFDNFYAYSIYKADGLPLPPENINVTRNEGLCTIETINTTDGVYFIELRSVQKEHAMVFDNTTIFNDTIYETETGYRQRRMKLKGFRTRDWNGDYYSPGFIFDKAEITEWQKYKTYLYADTVRYNGNYYSAKQNIAGAEEFDFNQWVALSEKPKADLIPNFEYKINQFEDFYSLDIDNFDDAQQKMAQHLIGYTPRVYLNNVFTNPITQYKFYQGFIKEKGTRNAVSKIAKSSIFNAQGEISYNEEWALRVGQYGAFSSFEEIEIKLEEGSFIENPQNINFVDSKPNNPIDLIYYTTASSLAIKPQDYLPSQTFVTTSTDNFTLPNAGYVSFEDITATAYNENSLLDIANSNQINTGDIFWLGFKSNGNWDVLRYTIQQARVTGVYVSSPGMTITFVTDLFHGLSVNDIIVVERFNDQVNGVYRVKSIPKLNQITVESTLVTILNEELKSPGLLYKFASARSASYDSLPTDGDMLRLPYGSKFWIDNETNGTYNWEVYNKIQNFNTRNIRSGLNLTGEKFGISLHKADNSNILLVGSTGFNNVIDNGRAYVFVKGDQTSNRLISFTLNESIDQIHPTVQNTEFGSSLAYNNKNFPGTNYGLIYVGSPGVSDVKSTGTILSYALSTATLQTYTNIGAVKVASINPVGPKSSTEIILLSPQKPNNERFGESLLFNNVTNLLLVGAPGTKSANSGRVYIYQSIVPEAKTTAITSATSGTTQIYISNTASIKAGYGVLIENLITNITDNFLVDSVVSTPLENYITLNQPIPDNCAIDSVIRFYNTASLRTTYGINVSPNGLITSFYNTITATTSVVGDQFGYAMANSADGKYTVISAPGGDYVETFVNIDSNSFIRTKHITPFSTGTRFGESVAMSSGGEYMFVGSPNIKNSDNSFGNVAVYTRTGNTFTYSTSIINPLPGAGANFGKKIAIDYNTSTLIISAIGVNKGVPVGFDAGSTNFDSSSTTFSDTITDFGTVYVYNKSANGNRFVLADNLLPPLTGNLSGNNFGYSLALDSTSVIVGTPAITSLSTSSFYQFSKIEKSKTSLDLYKKRSDIVDIETIQNIRLIDTFDEKVLEYLDVIDPIKGKISGLAEQELKYKAAYDPAVYSLGTAGVVVDTDTSWLDEHIGELWWDLSTVKYVLYEQGDLTYRKNNWGAVFPGATIDVYEWVRSPYLPSEWLALADTSRGLTEGISGQPKYADNSCIAVKQIYNSVSNSFSNVYYFWVKNKVTVPNSKNRRISAYQTANIIADPTGYGLRYAAPISNDAIALANVASLLVDNRVHLNISFDKIKNNRLKHTEWTLLEEGSATSMPPPLYEKKLFDSLLGRDNLGNLVPDPTLTEREKYGIGIRPRQTLFKNRREALRNIIEYTNYILSENQITGLYNFENLNSQELPPDETLNEYDVLLEDNEGLNIIDTRGFEQASLSCTVDNGRIRSVTIDRSGFGYRIAPNVVIGNGGFDAVITTVIDSSGRVIGANIVNAGRQYATAPTLYVRPFTALVLADNLYNGKWTKFEFDNITKQWNRKQTQKYNTTLYWSYIDWKSSTYNEFIDYTYTIDQVYQLDTLEDLTTGQYVKIKNIGDGRYAVVEKATQGDEGTFGKGYNLVYSQNGTIKISDEIWNVRETTLNFDQNNTYDQTLYDQFPDIELFYILTALKQDIFINELKINWNLLFFKAIKYALTEQKLLDWAFKTSFINVTNNAGLLGQTPIYKFFATDNYEDYLKEVKPYHSRIRSYTTNHGIFEPSNSNFTDFDLPAYYNENTDRFESVSPDDAITTQEPYKTWNENYPCKVGSIIVGNGGSGYTFAPQVTIVTAPGDTGVGASAKAYITSGRVSKIEVINPGSNYKLAPTVILSGGGDANLIPAKVYARIVNEKVRSNQIGIKFDRIARGSGIGERGVVDTFICDGSANEYVLTWYADIDKTKITVTLDQDLVLGSDYNLVNYEELYNGYTKKYTKVVFVSFVPSYGQILSINYLKNIELYNAAERILEFYQPNSGMPDNDLPQLMTGIEYPGVNVQGLPFDYSTSWDISYSPFGNFSYSDNVNYYKKADIIAPTVLGTDTVIVSDISGISLGQIVNIISADKIQSTSTVFYTQTIDPLKDVKVIDINTITNSIKFNSTLSTILTATTYQINEFDYIDLTNTNVLITTTASIEFWSYDANFSILDTAIDGGSWSTITNTLTGALGINPEDVIISGDFFLTPESSYAPEELVPGEVHDSLGINVYTRYNEGAPVIYNGTIDIFPNTITTATLTFLPPNKSSIFVTFDNKNFSYVDTTAHLLPTSLNYPNFSIDWTTGKITIGRQSNVGKLGYTIVGIGGGNPNSSAGVIDRDIQIVNDGSSQAELVSFSSSSTVKSAYVTVNGISIPNLNTLNTSTLGYVLTDSTTNPNRVAAKVVNLNTSTTSTVQAYFFGSTTKYFNEFKEQTFIIGFDLIDTFILDQPPGIIEPAAANIIVEKDIGNGFVRLQPPFISYYKVDPTVLVYKVDNNIDRTGLGFIATNIRLYLNGVKLTYALDWDFDYSTQLITIKPNILQENDVLAILGIPTGGTGPAAEYDIEGNTLRLLSPIANATLKVTTFTNHDDMMVRTETFEGSFNRRFKVSRFITNSNYVWVTVDGILLVNGIDFTVLDDGKTIQLSDKWHPDVNNKVNITTISSDRIFDTTLGYRIFNDIFNRTHYKRLSKKNSTTLAKELYSTDKEIHVVDSSIITPPLNSKKIPGIVYINGERIEFTNLDGNVLRNVRRSTIGTGAPAYLPAGTKVVDQGLNQNIPYRDNILKQTIITTSTTASYVISATTFISSSTILDTQLINSGIVLSTTATINPVDQIEVYYNNRKLRKSGVFKHDISSSFDSPEFILMGTTSSSAVLPITDVINSAYIVTSTNEVWVFTNSLEETAINGYVYKGLKYYPPEFTVSVSINTQTAAIYASTASSIVSTSTQDLAFDIDGSGTVTANDVAMYTSLANGNYVDGISINSNYRDLLVQHITLNIDGGIQDNVKMVIVKKEFDKQNIWNSQITNNSTYSLLESSTIQARFLQAATAELPNETNFYGSIQPLDTNSGLVLTNENNEPLEGL